MKLTFLGTNGWFADKNRNTICTLLETEKYYIVFDAGDGLNKLGEHIKTEKPIFLFLSHVHLDHIIGFHALGRFGFKNEFKIFCRKGSKKHLDLVIAHPFTEPIEDLKLDISIVELEEGIHDFDFQVECRDIFHMDGAFGYSVFVDNKKITYLCDTGLCESSKTLAKNADVVLHECSMREGISNDDWGHSSSVGAAMVAKDAGAKRLILTHLNSVEFPEEKDREEALKKANEIFENTEIAEDDKSVDL